MAVTASIVSLGFVIFRLAAQHLPLFGDQMDKRAIKYPAPLIAAGAHGRKAVAALGGLLLFVVLGMAYAYTHKPDAQNAGAAQATLPADFDGTLDLPAPIAFEMSDDSPGQVVFDHESHVDPFAPNCVNCHAATFKIHPQKAGALGSINYEELHEDGKQCGSCHNDNDAFGIEDGCEFCHQTE